MVGNGFPARYMQPSERHLRGDVAEVPQLTSSMGRVRSDCWPRLPAQEAEAIMWRQAASVPVSVVVVLHTNTSSEPLATAVSDSGQSMLF